MVHSAQVVTDNQSVVGWVFICMDTAPCFDISSRQFFCHCGGFRHNRESQGAFGTDGIGTDFRFLPAVTAAHYHDGAFVRIGVFLQPSVDTVCLPVFGSDIGMDISAVDMDFAAKRFGLLFDEQAFANFVGKSKGGFILDVQVAGEMTGGQPLCRVGKQSDGIEVVLDGKFSAGKHCAGGNAEGVVAEPAPPLSAAGDTVGFVPDTAFRTDDVFLAAPTDSAQQTVSRFVGQLRHFNRSQRSGFGGK